MSQTDSDSQERDFEDDVSTTSTQGSEISTDNKSETKEEMDPWLPLIEEAKQRINIKNARCATGIHNKISETFSDRKFIKNTSFRLPVCSLRKVK
jgi:hypothetical protein